MYQRHRDEGLFVLTLVGQTRDGSDATVEDVKSWADTFGLTTPVLIDADGAIRGALVGEEDGGFYHNEHLVGPGAVLLVRNTYMRESDIVAFLE